MHKQHGFTLLELGMVMLIMGLLLGGMLLPLSTELDRRNIADTDRQLEQIKEALLGFAAANGRLPCPASSSSAGKESFSGTGTASTGACSNFSNGYLPAATLGLTPVDPGGFAVDAWRNPKNRIRYAVYTGTINGVTNPFTRTDGLRTASMAPVAAAPQLLLVCASIASSSSCNGSSLADTAPFVVFSLGRNAGSSTSGSSADESANLDGNQVFVSHSMTIGGGNEFDDQLTWGSLNTLFSRMIAAGTLP